jgi:transposase InsO family protein
LKARGLVTSPAFIVMKAADKFAKPDGEQPRTLLDDFSRYIVAWKLCTTMSADDVTDTLEPYHPMTQGKIERWHWPAPRSDARHQVRVRPLLASA